MGYQVGNTCYATKQLAENAYFSQVVPVITLDGVKQVRYSNGQWHYGSQYLTAELPECSQAANYKQGYDLAALLLPTAVMLMVAKLIINLIKSNTPK